VLAYAADPRRAAGEEGEESQAGRKLHRRRALVTIQKYRAGHVLFLGFDGTWRFRYRVGDAYHHKFWSQVLRWAVADRPPSASRLVGIGVGKTQYRPQENVTVEAKILDGGLNPLAEAESKTVAVRALRAGKQVIEGKMLPVPGSLGAFEADLGEVGARYGPGDYRVELVCPAAEAILRKEGKPGPVAARFRVTETAHEEQKQLAADFAAAEELARVSGGSVIRPHEAAGLADELPSGLEVRVERAERPLWDSWRMLAAIVATAVAEWALRKKVGLV